MASNVISATSVEPKILRSAYLPATTEAAQYTVPASTSVKVATASITNISGSAVNVTLSLVPTGGSLDNTHRILMTYSLPALDTLELSMMKGAMLGPGDIISGFTNAANAVALVVTGTVHS